MSIDNQPTDYSGFDGSTAVDESPEVPRAIYKERTRSENAEGQDAALGGSSISTNLKAYALTPLFYVINLYRLAKCVWISFSTGEFSKFSRLGGADVPRAIQRRLLAIIWLRGICHRNDLFCKRATKAASDLQQVLSRESSRQPENPETCRPVEKVDIDTIDPAEFLRDFRANPRPVVVTGLNFDTDDWSLDWFVENYPDTKVVLTNPKSDANFMGPLSMLRKKVDPPYLHNCEQLFLQNKELLDGLRINRLREMFGMTFNAAQMFFGAAKSSGSAFHCANELNLFIQVKGQKKWRFVDPSDSALLYPVVTRANAYQSCLVRGLDYDKDVAKYPLYRYCTRYEVTLNPGDMLINPPWWWHSVSNVTDETIGVATRWFGSNVDADLNRVYHGLFSWYALEHPGNVLTTIKNMLNKKWTTLRPASGTAKEDFMTTLLEDFSHDDTPERVAAGDLDIAWFQGRE